MIVPAQWHGIPELPGEYLVHSALEREGLWNERKDFRAAIRVALMHRSYVYENASEVAPVTAGTLEVLRRLGATSVAARIGVSVYQHLPRGPLGEASDRINQLVSGLGAWSRDSLSFLADGAALGRSLKGRQLPSKVATILVHQLAGAFELLDDDRFVIWLSEQYVAPSLSGGAISLLPLDAKSLLQRCLAPEVPQFEFGSSGPDHAKTFNTVLSTRDGRRAHGEGNSKKAAGIVASVAYLKAYFPDKLLLDRATETRVSPKVPLALPWSKRQRLQEIASQFKVPTEQTALLLQAFMHGSWVYENRTFAQECGQQDNAQLALLGSSVASHLFSRSVAREALQADVDDDWSFRTLPNHALSIAFDSLGLSDLMFLGRAQSLLGVPTEMKSNVVQAFASVLYLSAGSFAQLEASWPSSQADALRAMAPEQNVEIDSTTKLQIFASATSLTFEEFYEEKGRDHEKVYRCTLKLSSPTMHRTISVSASDFSAGKKPAKQQAAKCVLDGFLTLADLGSVAASNAAASSSPILVSFLLAHLASAIPTSTDMVGRWHSLRLLGSQHAGNPTALREWARQADNLITRQALVEPDTILLGAFYDAARSLGGVGGQPLRARLLGVLEWVEGLQPDDARRLKQEDEWVRLICMANLVRARATGASPKTVRNLFEEWPVLHPTGATLELEGNGQTSTLPAASAAAVALFLDSYLLAVGLERPVRVVIQSEGEGVSIELIPFAGSPDLHTRQLNELLSLVSDADLGVAVTCGQGDSESDVRLRS